MSILSPAPPQQNNELLEVIIQHWAKARIDAPLQLIERLDGLARQLILIGGGLEAVTATVLKLRPPADPRVVIVALWGLGFLLAMIASCAVLLVHQSKQLHAYPIYELVRFAPEASLASGLDRQIQAWCVDIDRVVSWKRRCLALAMLFLMFAFIATFICVRLSLF